MIRRSKAAVRAGLPAAAAVVHRIVPTHKVVMGWKMSPSHNLGQDLAEVWLNT